MGATRLVTRCPACRTAFRVVADQLRLRQGLVRCGHCDTVFDARDHLIEVPVTPAEGASAAAAPAVAPAALPSLPASPPSPPPATVGQTGAFAPLSADGGDDGKDDKDQGKDQDKQHDKDDDERRLPVWSRELEAGYDVPALDAPTVMMFDDADFPARTPVPDRDADQAARTADAAGTSARDGEPGQNGDVPNESRDDGDDGHDENATDGAHGEEPIATFVPGVIEDDAGDEPTQRDEGDEDDKAAKAEKREEPEEREEREERAAPASAPVSHSAGGYLRAPAQDTVLDTDRVDPIAGATAAAVAREQTTRKWVRQDVPADPPPASARLAAGRFSPDFLRHGHPGEIRTPQARAADGRRRRAIALRVALVLLVLAAILAGVHLARGELAGRFPGLRPALEAACAPLGCEVPPWRDIDALRIESSQLQKLDDQGDEYQLSVALRNHGAAVVALPAIELVLTDLQDDLLLRRVLQPADYLQPAERGLARQGLAANTELPVRVRFRTPDSAANYRVLIYYP